MVYNTERGMSSEDQNNLDKATMSVSSKGSDKVVSDDKSDIVLTMVQRAWDQRAQMGSFVITSLILKVGSILRRPCGLERKVKGI